MDIDINILKQLTENNLNKKIREMITITEDRILTVGQRNQKLLNKNKDEYIRFINIGIR